MNKKLAEYFLKAVIFYCFFTAAVPAESVVSSPAGGLKENQCSEFVLSPDDEIEIGVYKHEELSRTVRIPADGILFFPIVGEINSTGKTIKELREIIINGLSRPQEQTLLPGDEITISVLMHEEYSRRLVIPSDGYIFFPYVGDIHVESLSTRKVREIIAKGLDNKVVDPQVVIDIVKMSNPQRIANPQVSIEVTSFNGKKVVILGEVNAPGVYSIANERVSLLESIARAGGFTDNATKRTIVLLRPGREGENPEMCSFSIKKYLHDGEPEQNTFVQKGDIIYVHRSAIANIDRFLKLLANVVTPLYLIENGVWIKQNIDEGPKHVTTQVR